MNAAHRQEFCVRWNSHLGSIGAAFPQLLAGQRFVDVTLACEGHQVHCHRLVLAACSSYFESILAENPCKHPVIILPSEIKLWEIQALVDFMYKGEVNVTQAGLPQLLRCAEQLRIRGLYGSDAALNLNQLKALTNKVVAAATGGGGGGGINDSAETDDTGTNSTSTTTSNTTAGSALLKQAQQQQHAASLIEPLLAKKELLLQQQANGNALQQQQLLLQQQNHQVQMQHATPTAAVTAAATTTAFSSNIPTEYESADDSTSNAYDQYEEHVAGNKVAGGSSQTHLDSTVEEDHNYVAAHDEDDSFGTGGDTEHDNSAHLQASTDAAASYKRVRRSEASLAQAAKCVSKGQTFQTVSNMFNIPVSTIRFYMARKGILPKRKRGRGASTANASVTSSAVMSQALAQIKAEPQPYHLAGFKINERGAANMI